MPHFYFDVHNGHGDTLDEEGVDLMDQAAARQIAVESIRSMVAEDARKGIIDLDGRIDVRDGARNILLTVCFAEAFWLTIPDSAKGGPK